MPRCRFCSSPLEYIVVDLGVSPLANSNVTTLNYCAMEPSFPLRVYLCDSCGLVQLPEFSSPESIFTHYDYFSSFSDTWLQHASKYADQMVEEHGLNSASQVVEVASNDGYLLQYFIKHGVKVLGVEPALNVAKVAKDRGVPTESLFFGRETACELQKRGYMADLIVANNVLAHVPAINDFVAGFRVLLKPDGIATVEFPHLLNLIRGLQFDSIYHEHFSYLSLSTVRRIFEKHGLKVFNVQEIPTHGGSLRVFACLQENLRAIDTRVGEVLNCEKSIYLDNRAGYKGFAESVEEVKLDLLEFLIRAKRKGKKIAGYGAAAKGNTLINFAGIKPDLIAMIADKNPYKQDRYTPGSRIPIVSPEKLLSARPDHVIVLPWNIREEVMKQLAVIREWGGSFITAIPQLREWK